MYNINILNDVNDDNLRVAIISAVTEMMTREGNLNVTRMNRGKLESPIWNAILRQDNLK